MECSLRSSRAGTDNTYKDGHGARPRQRQGGERVTGVAEMSGTGCKPGGRMPPRAHERTAQGSLEGGGREYAPELRAAPAAAPRDTDFRPEAHFMGRMLAAAVNGAGSARMAALVVRELAACGIGVGTSRHGPGDVLPLRREGSEAVRPGFAVLCGFERYRREIAALLRLG